jgi:hypothetical protein
LSLLTKFRLKSHDVTLIEFSPYLFFNQFKIALLQIPVNGKNIFKKGFILFF